MDLVQRILPLVIKDRGGKIIEVSLSNEKGFKKSLERGVLWHLHKDTGRLLPYSEDALSGISEHASWYEAQLGAGKVKGPVPADKEDGNTEKKSGEGVTYQIGSNTLRSLEELLKRRQLELPEGSYTTHLFSSGAEKIRKKTGEEAVELILAPGRDEIVYESADLIYHMMVLLVSEGISIDEVLAELDRRSDQG